MSNKLEFPARLAAVELLSIVLDDNEPLEIGLQNSSSFDDLAESSDRAFAHLLVKSCLCHLGEIDTAIKQFLKKPIPEKANRVRHILRIGATRQLIVLKTAPHAAVDTSVRLAKGTRLAGFGGLINAVLRRISELESLEAEDAAKAAHRISYSKVGQKNTAQKLQLISLLLIYRSLASTLLSDGHRVSSPKRSADDCSLPVPFVSNRQVTLRL